VEVEVRVVSGNLAGRVSVIGGFVVMVIVFAFSQPDTFLQASTGRNILDQSVVPVILAAGLTFVLVTGEFDLSFTATLGLSAALVIVLMTHDVPVLVALLIGIVASGLIGLVVGVLVTLGRASSFIVTLAVGSAVTGLELATTGNKTIYEDIPAGFADLSQHEILGLRWPVWFAFLVVIGTAVLLHATRFGRQARAIGGNAQAAYLAGVKVRKLKIITFVLVGVLTACAAIILTSRSASYYPNASAGFLLNTYAAAFLGAAIGAQSNFTVAGSAFGVVWITTLQTGLTLNNQPAWTSNLIQGVVLAAAVLIASRGRREAS
jgi:ribose transport system permease protein